MHRWYSWLAGTDKADGDANTRSGSRRGAIAADTGQSARSGRFPKRTSSATPTASSNARESSVESWGSGSRTLVDALPNGVVKVAVIEESPVEDEGKFYHSKKDARGHITIDPRPDSISIPELYYQCQNLAYYPQAPSLARRFLLDLLTPVLQSDSSASDSICSLGDTFDADYLQTWLTAQHRRTAQRFEDYLERRKGTGGQREMFLDRADAVRWCQQSAVVKYVDGSWVQTAFQSTSGLDIDQKRAPYTAHAARTAARVSWQVLSEELGDGDLAKEHCAVYENLMDSLAGSRTSKADEEDFYEWNKMLANGQLPNKQPYVAAMLQLAMSISPNEFLPEMLGFNLSYEGLPYHLLVTSHELKELKIDPYYFVLHISIDNSHSGHSAMARMSVEDLLTSMRDAGIAEAQISQVWKRVQAGYMLADSYRTTPKLHHELSQYDTDPPCWQRGVPLARENMHVAAFGAEESLGAGIPIAGRAAAEDALLQIFRSKAAAADGVHCAASAKIAGRRIADWLQPESLAGRGGNDFVAALADSPVWIRKDEFSDRSKLIRECEWGGRMFGAFTMSEVEVMRQWARSLEADGRNGTKCLAQVLPSSIDLNDAAFEPYTKYLSGGDPETTTHLLERSRYFDQAIQPLDLTGFFETSTDFSSVTRSAPKVYEECLRHAHGIRGPLDIDVSQWLRNIVDANGHCHSDAKEHEDLADCLVANMPRCDLATAAGDSERIRHMLPSLFLSSAPLEWLQSVGPAKLAGPLGMAVVKIQRSLMGFSSEENDEETCCYGLDDVTSIRPGLWELASEIHADGSDATLASFLSCEGASLTLPALILSLHTQPTLHMPILLGIQLALNVMLHEPLSHWKHAPTPFWRKRLGDMVMQSRRWIIEAIQVGASDVEGNRRGWEGRGDWIEDVRLGYMMAQRCLLAV